MRRPAIPVAAPATAPAAFRVPLAAAALVVLVAGAAPSLAGDTGSFVDEARCAACHAAEAAAWRGSHHDLAMQTPGPGAPAAVLGDFGGAAFDSAGLATRFSRRGDAFVVTTDGPDGSTADFEVRHVLGVTPLQQVLLPLPSGRLQALSVAWDTDAKRWYHLYPGERIDHRDELHWTRPSQNWNFMCAECHSTDVDKGYDAATDRYDTRWFREDVGCQACHGPGAAHVAWADARAGAPPAASGVAPRHDDGGASNGTPSAASGGARPVGAAAAGLAVDLAAASSTVQVEACARCHSRRSVIAPEYAHGQRLMDSHLPSLLDQELYFVDGQVRGEVYEYASFLQSRMAARGLRCSDCHDPHSARLKAEGDALCTTCHNNAQPAARAGIDTSGLVRKRYDTADHHFHPAGGRGSRCVDCHAPSTVFMGVDARADHSFRIPRPDLGATLGTPDACTSCHADRGAAWADGVIRAHRAPGAAPRPHFAAALHAGREGLAGAVQGLAALAGDASLPGVVRATALDELASYPGAATTQALVAALADADPIVRRTSAAAFATAPPEARPSFLVPLLSDPVRAVRIEAARQLLPAFAAPTQPVPVAAQHAAPDTDAMRAALASPAQRAAWDKAVGELEASYRANEDRAEGRLGLAELFASRGQADEAVAACRSALALDPASVPAAVNLADLLRARGEDAAGEAVLREALARRPGDPSIQHALALVLVRLGRRDEARTMLVAAAKAAPERADIAYAAAAALADAGRTDEAIVLLEEALRRNAGNRDLRLALVVFQGRRGRADEAARHLTELRAINPDDPALAQ